MARDSDEDEDEGLGTAILVSLWFVVALVIAGIILIAIVEIFAINPAGMENAVVPVGVVIFVGSLYIAQRWYLWRLDPSGANLPFLTAMEKICEHVDRVKALSTSEASREAAILLADETCFKRTPVSGFGTPLPGGIPDTVRELLESTERIEGVNDFVNLVIDRQAVKFRNSVELQIGAWTLTDGDSCKLQIGGSTVLHAPSWCSFSITVNVENGEALFYTYPDEDHVSDRFNDSDEVSDDDSDVEPVDDYPSLYHLIVIQGGAWKLDDRHGSI